jgi:hypothetical protein
MPPTEAPITMMSLAGIKPTLLTTENADGFGQRDRQPTG